MLLVAVDPDYECCGVAVWRGNGGFPLPLLTHSMIPTEKLIRNPRTYFNVSLEHTEQRTVVVEGQYVKDNPLIALGLARVAGRIEGAFLSGLDFDFAFEAPVIGKSWIIAMLKMGSRDRITTDQVKSRSIKRAMLDYPQLKGQTITHHEAAALCMGTWYMNSEWRN
jgi:hypothetical protein